MFSSSGCKVEKFSKTKKQSRNDGGKEDNRKQNKTSRGGKKRYEDDYE